MLDGSNLVYIYDGSFEGLLCCVFESYEKKEMPSDILPPAAPLALFDAPRRIDTVTEKAQRVFDSIPVKISREAQELVKLAFLTCAEQKELLILRFLRIGFKVGARVMSLLTDDTVSQLQKAVHHLTLESHKYKGFVRFSIYNNALLAVIEPKNFVLPLLAAHFANRFRNEVFMIYDQTHKVALVHQGGRTEIVEIEDLEVPPLEENEAEFRRLWQQYYHTIGIESRSNPRCRMTFMPKRFWKHLTEFYPMTELTARKRLE